MFNRSDTKFLDRDVDAYLSRIVESGCLKAGTKRLAMLTYLLKTEAKGDGKTIKAYSIAVDALGRPTDFDPSIDSIVRVEMGRIREAITLFENGKFADSRIVVSFPTGTYRPVIAMRASNSAKPATVTRSQKERSFRFKWTALA